MFVADKLVLVGINRVIVGISLLSQLYADMKTRQKQPPKSSLTNHATNLFITEGIAFFFLVFHASTFGLKKLEHDVITMRAKQFKNGCICIRKHNLKNIECFA